MNFVPLYYNDLENCDLEGGYIYAPQIGLGLDDLTSILESGRSNYIAQVVNI